MKTIYVLALALLCLLGGGCCALITGNSEEIWLTSDPPGVSVHVDGKVYETPCKVRVSRSEEHQVTFADGQRVELKHSKWGNGWMWGNLIWTPSLVLTLVALAVDGGTGAAKDLEPDDLHYWNGRVYDLERDPLPDDCPLVRRYDAEREAHPRALRRELLRRARWATPR